MSGSNNAVFLSYAREDAEAALRICEALRAAGIEVWFDQSELRGGDAWDQSIRKQIKDAEENSFPIPAYFCAALCTFLPIPADRVIGANFRNSCSCLKIKELRDLHKSLSNPGTSTILPRIPCKQGTRR